MTIAEFKPSAALWPEVPAALIDELRTIVGERGWTSDPTDLEPHLRDWVGYAEGTTPIMLMPKDTAEVAAVVRACVAAGVPIVPQGGNTGSVAGAIPHGEVLVSLRRMNRIREVDAADYTITVDAGVVLGEVHAAANEVDRFFPLSIGSEGSCTIGGNVSTNAGGTAVLRYGNMRDLVLGLEVVLPDGRVWNGLRRLRKDNTGYALKHLFVGAEGTLGIVTGAVLRLFPPPVEVATAFVAIRDLDASIELLSLLRAATGDALSSLEVMPRIGLDIALEFDSGVVDPLAARHDWYAIVEVSGTKADGQTEASLEATLAGAMEKGIVVDATMAASTARTKAIWCIRKALVLNLPKAGAEVKHDVAVPVSKQPDFIRRATAAVEKVVPGTRTVAYGHFGDGNVHFNLCAPPGMDASAFTARATDLHRAVYDIAAEYGGSFAAEHGIGIVKLEEMERYRSPVEVELMRGLKSLLDPSGLFNPGRVLQRRAD
jgi:FAD/FMN-containing dehydrogenase